VLTFFLCIGVDEVGRMRVRTVYKAAVVPVLRGLA